MDGLHVSGNPAGLSEPNDFDFGAFLREDTMDIETVGAQSSDTPALSNSPNDSSSQTGGAGPSSEMVRASSAAARQRHERRGHTKSRRGCFNCKRRRIKETRPACGHCVKTGLKCEYPSSPQVIHQPHHQIPLFSLQDMRFFQHFLLKCYPAVPISNESVWTHEVPCLSHEHEYLMHAMLGLAASDLMEEDPSLITFAMSHRLRAIKSIKKRLADMSRSTQVTHDESNAMVATCFALTFQSVQLDDGMAEFMAFVRGILIVSMQMWMKGVSPIFTNMVSEDAEALLEPLMRDLPLVQREWSDMALTAIQNLRPLCYDEVEIEYCDLMIEWVQKLYTSSWDAYKCLRRHYGWWMMLPHDKFRRIIDPSNQVMILLATHWISLKQIMGFITDVEESARAMEPGGKADDTIDPGLLRWLKFSNRQIDTEHRVYNTWPEWVEERLERDVSFFGRTKRRH
ncbi:related to UPC2 - regulatory protein involved in control of sterol uptake [Cephalotrichum gorgonifer]|uniref:Related to UPC2 - regulatory protein involved in control of sterol uptake n=1 Tax=Cephalotrichum gorgonifer TaxID=2041049 RepID=A0AAE8MZC1_9PEZI|nr:related to UPC2 - regulatory protein involved in control of sterol uptake [Cephalotrichum gorgonifer]